jgi:uncharacterized hydrophobic protein (TIGR00271 family)
MPTITEADLTRMTGGLLFDGADRARKLSRFWVLLALAAVIASAGVVSDSTATVIGAMIVAPLMTPILGTVLSVVIGDLRNLAVSLLLVVSGAALVVAIGWAIGTLVSVDVVAATNSQVAGRVQPRLIDLLAAVATGVVGAFALVRSDVSDTLPGVAIAISLVPPLAVVGLTLEAGAGGEAAGALLLFLTNVGAILLSGLIVMAAYRVSTARPVQARRRLDHRAATAVVVIAVVALALPLSASSQRIATETLRDAQVTDVATAWAEARDWEVVGVENTPDGVEVRAIGPLPVPDAQTLRAALDRDGLQELDVQVELVPVERTDLPGR